MLLCSLPAVFVGGSPVVVDKQTEDDWQSSSNKFLRRGHRHLQTTTTVDNMVSSFDPSNVDSPYFYFGIPGVISFNEAVITQENGAVTQTIQAHSTTFGPSPNGVLDHVKTLQYAKALYAPSEPNGKVRYELQMSGKQLLPESLPFPSEYVTNPDDDLRLGSAAMNAADFTTFIVADIFLTNTGIWALNERLPFGWAPGNIYQAYTQVKRVADRNPDDVHELAIEYDKGQGAIRWLVEGVVVAETTQIGFPDPSFDTVINHGGTPTAVAPDSMQFGWGQFTFLDAIDPNNVEGQLGLVRLNPDPNFYQSPAAFYDDISLDENRLFGQGTTQTVFKFKVKVD